MIKLEDIELEEYILGEKAHIAVPFELHMKNDGDITIVAYSFTKEIAEEFEKRYSSDPFSDEAKAFLHAKLDPVMEKLGYDCANATERITLEYRVDKVDESKILPECVIVDSLAYENWDDLPLDEFALYSECEYDRMAVIRQNEKIVCFAGINDISQNDDFYELTVECESEYRRRGYASSCVALLTKYLLGIDCDVNYICTDDNVASKMTAESAGFELYDKCLPFVCYREFDE